MRSRSTARSREASIAISDLPLSPTYEISRPTLREIAPSIAISIQRDLAKTRSRSTVRSRNGAISIFARLRSTARSREASIAISDRGRRTGAHEIGTDWSSEFADDCRTNWNVSSPLAHARVLSLSLIFRKYFEGKIEV